MRHRFRRQHQGTKIARHRRARSADPGQSRPSRRGRGRSAGRRRRRLPDPDAGRAAARLGGPPGPDLAAARPLCRRDVLSAVGRTGACHRDRACRAFHPRRGPDAGRLARRADRHDRARRSGHRDDAVDQPGDRRLQPRDRRSGRLRAQDPDDPQAGAEQRRRDGRAPRAAGVARALHAVLLDPHPRLQGPAAGAAGRQLLRGFAQPADGLGAGAGPSAVFDQHLPVVAARPPVPVSVPQRRDQHGPRQRQLDGGAPPGDDVGAAWAPISPRWCR